MAKMSIDQFREFSSAVVRHLPPIDSEEAQLLIDEQRRLAAILTNAFKTPDLWNFRVVMSSDIPWDIGGGQGGCEVLSDFGVDNVDHWMSGLGEYWPKEDDEPKVLDFHLKRLGLPMSGREALLELDKRGLRPATLTETVFFFAQYRNFFTEETYCRKELLSIKELFPVVILEAQTEEKQMVAVIDEKEIHGGWLGDIFTDDAVYPAVTK